MTNLLRGLGIAVGILAICTIPVKGQKDLREGFVIKENGDTLRGWINVRRDKKNSSECSFRSSTEDNPVNFKPHEIKAYGLHDGKLFVSRTVLLNDTLSQIFAEYLVNGYVDLFYFSDGEDHYFIEKEGQSPILLNYEQEVHVKDGKTYMTTSKKYIGLMKIAFSDKPELYQEIDRTAFSKEPMKELVQQYNKLSAAGEQGITFDKEVQKVHIRIGPVIGMDDAHLKFREAGYSEFNFGWNLNYTVGAAINLTLPYINQNISFQFESLYKPSKFQGDHTFIDSSPTPNYTDLTSVTINYDNWENKLCIKYSFPKGKIRPTFSLGGVHYGFFRVADHKQNIRTTYYPEKIQTTDSYGTFTIGKGTIGLYAGVGCNIKILKNSILFLQADYNRTQSTISSFASEFIDMHSLALKTGILF